MNFLSNCFQKLLTLSSNLKWESALAFLKHLSTALLKELEEDTSLKKLLPTGFLNKRVFKQRGFWDNLFPFLFESKYIKQLIANGSSKAYLYHGASRFIDNLCVIYDGNEFVTSFKNIYPTELELKIEYEGNHASSFLETDIKMLLHQTILCYHTGYHMGHMDITMCHHLSNF